MTMKAPELTGYWFDDEVLAARGRVADESPDSDQEALDDLADRVTAARSIY
jgi:hypothetical protein